MTDDESAAREDGAPETGSPAPNDGADPDTNAGPDTSAESSKPVTDDLVTTQHVLTTPAGELRYTARTGRVVLHEDKIKDGAWLGRKPRAQVAITAYTADDIDPAERPVTFAFNGGPGSASVWLHMGLLGPKRVLMGDAGDLAPPPYGIADNPESLLAVSDLVFIDPVSTGQSRAVAGEKPGDFHGFTADIESVAEIIRQWVSAEGRWLSPKFLAGESYGTVRAAGLAEHLQQRGMYLNGLMLISTILDYSTGNFDRGMDRPYAMFLPFYAATAWYHGKHGDRPLPEVLAEAEAYAQGDYLTVLARGSRLTDQERADAVAKLAQLTGLSEDYVDRADLRLEHWRVFGELLRDERKTVGRLDSRFTGPAASGIAEHMDADPSMDAIMGPYAAALQHYLHHDLGLRDTSPMHVIGPEVLKNWSYKEFENAPVYVIDKLSRAMRQNPHLAVYFAYGYFDGATPYWAAEDSVAHLRIPESARDNLEHNYYEAGHMMYVHEPSRLAQSADLADFVRRRSGR